MQTKNTTNVLTTEDLGHFTGTAQYWRAPLLPFVYTDGVRHVAHAGMAVWLLYQIAAWQYAAEVRNNERLYDFQLWELKVYADWSAELLCSKDTGELFLKDKLPWTAFPLSYLKLYLTGMGPEWQGGVLMLPSEYQEGTSHERY